jgi:hypothetical protein
MRPKPKKGVKAIAAWTAQKKRYAATYNANKGKRKGEKAAAYKTRQAGNKSRATNEI